MDYTELFNDLHRLDWTYMMSDDNRVFTRGQAAERAMRSRCRGDQKAEQMYADFYVHVWNQGPQPKLEHYVDQNPS